ncbi:MAG TPA: N-6 DNA methylase, partial [Spirochaetales bacterium]|nr:N-6 DNA methylase [Spirochaetales bacterium]
RLVTDIPEEDFQDAVQIIGWMYQYYNTEPKQAVFDGLKKNIKITKEKIPAATQLFTPDWIVRYMVENSLGRLWLESHPNDTLKANWKYYLDEAEQTPEVAENLRILRSQSPVKSPEDIRLIDPCMGSGHILVYAFDVLMQIYESEGYNPRDAARSILEKNIYGLDIDRRAYQLAYFALMMKARQYNRRAFDPTSPRPQVYHPAGWSDGEEYGSLVKVDTLPPKPELPKDQLTIFDDYEHALRVWNFKRLLAQKYDVVVTNPPYAGSNGLTGKISDFLKKHYPYSKSDLFSAFIEKCIELANKNGYTAMITQQAYMFLGTFEKLRVEILKSQTVVDMLHFGYGTFGADFGTTSFVFKNGAIPDYIGLYYRLVDTRNADDKRIVLEQNIAHPQRGVVYCISQSKFKSIPGNNFSYWISDDIINILLNSKQLSDIATIRVGMHTGDNEIFVRDWYEVSFGKFTDNCSSHEESKTCGAKWFPYNKGGGNRRWYGYRTKIVNWQFGGAEIHKFHNLPDDYNGAPVRAKGLQFKEGITWSDTGSTGIFAARFSAKGAMFDVKGSSAFLNKDYLWYVLAFLNVKIATHILNMFNPTITYQVGNISTLPFVVNNKWKQSID